MTPRLKLVVALAAGVVLAGPPVVALNLWLQGLDERQDRDEIDAVAGRVIAIAESRIGRVMAALNELAQRSVDSCRPAHIDALRQAVFATMPAKEISVVSADGRTLCTDIGQPLERRTLISSEPANAEQKFLLEVVHLGDRAGQWVRIRRPGSGTNPGLAALIPTELLSVSLSSQGTPLQIHVRIATRSGTIISDTGTIPVGAQAAADSMIRSYASERVALKVIVARSRLAPSENHDNLRALAIIASGIVAILILGIALLLPKRQPENPITELERALAAGEFVPYYQPIVDIRSGRLKGAEALARWRKSDGTVVSPASFIPLAESSGLIVEMTRVLMRRMCQELGPAFGRRPHLKISFNLTAQHFADEEIVKDVRQIFNKSPVRLSQVVLEVTERQPLDNLTETRRVIAALQGLGVRIAIDDVGTGHSGLSYMLKLGVDIIKIDKVFIDSIGTDRNSHTIIETLIDLAQNMRMDTVAEGVETFEQVVALRELGIRSAQGFVFAPPLPGSAFLELIEAIDPVKQMPEPGAAQPPRAKGLPSNAA